VNDPTDEHDHSDAVGPRECPAYLGYEPVVDDETRS